MKRDNIYKIILGLLFILCCYYIATYDERNVLTYKALINDQDSHITKVTLKNNFRKVTCEDSQVLNDLLLTMRSNVADEDYNGERYHFDMVDNHNNSISGFVYVSKESISISLGGGYKNWGDNIRFCDAKLPSNISENTKKMIDFLTEEFDASADSHMTITGDHRIEIQ